MFHNSRCADVTYIASVTSESDAPVAVNSVTLVIQGELQTTSVELELIDNTQYKHSFLSNQLCGADTSSLGQVLPEVEEQCVRRPHR